MLQQPPATLALACHDRSARPVRLLYTISATLDGVSTYGVGGQVRPRRAPSLFHRLVGRDDRGRKALPHRRHGLAPLHGRLPPRETTGRRSGRDRAEREFFAGRTLPGRLRGDR